MLLRAFLFPFLLLTFAGMPFIARAERNHPFSTSPTDQEIFSFHCFTEPLVPSGKTTPAENQVLTAALEAYFKAGSNDDVSVLTEFLKQNPTSKWRISLLTNLGRVYFDAGRFSLAMQAWQEAWELGQKEEDPKIKPVVDLAVAELAKLNSRLGRTDQIDRISKEIKDRPVGGPANVLLEQVRENRGQMRVNPGDSFLCGPLAILKIREASGIKNGMTPEIQALKSTAQGTNLVQLRNLCNQLGMNYEIAFRPPGAEVILPALVHWKLGHFAAMTRQDGNRFLIEDLTFAKTFWITKETLDSEASGYCLIPAKKFPPQWNRVADEDGKSVWGKGYATIFDPQRTGKCDKKSGGGNCNGTATYAIHLLLVSLNINDTPVFYNPPVGPAMDFTVRYNQKDADQPTTYSYSNFGSQWTCDWIGYVKETSGQDSSDVDLYCRGGGWENFSFYGVGATPSQLGLYTNSTLVRKTSTRYERTFKDGSMEIYDYPDATVGINRKVFLTKIVDPQGNAITIHYDSQFRLDQVTDAVGQTTTFSYDLPGDPLKITKVTEPFGRVAKFDYTNGQLTKITDAVGLTSVFTYQSNNFIDTMTTAYGKTTFAYTEAAPQNDWSDGMRRTLTATDPMGGMEKVEFFHDWSVNNNTGIASSDPSSQVPPDARSDGFHNYNLQLRNTFYWNKKAMMDAPNNYLCAQITHWKHWTGYTSASGVVESTKAPLENRVYYFYDAAGPYVPSTGNANNPNAIERMLDDQSVQIYRFGYNNLGLLTSYTDPAGRSTALTYYPINGTDGIDLQRVSQTTGGLNDTLASYGPYNALHEPATMTDAAGQTTSFLYNAQGQLTNRTVVRNGQNETTTWNYANNYLMNITGPVAGATTAFTYDGGARIKTVADSESYTLTKAYDALNRPTTVTFPDGTYTQIIYDRLDPHLLRDRLGRWTTQNYDNLRRMTAVIDPLNRTTQYNWCACGSLKSIVDANGNMTSFTQDIQSRLRTKTDAANRALTYTYEGTTSRLQSTQDAKSQTTTYSYNLDNSLAAVTYTGAQYATPNVSYGYDANYPRITSVGYGTGSPPYATQYLYTYKPVGTLGANRVSTVDGPLANDTVAYGYDELGHVLTTTINGVGATVAYDALERLTTATNPLGTFNYFYVNQTNRLDHVDRPGGQKVAYSYLDNLHDQRLAEIKNLGPASARLSQFDYTYDAVGNISKWTQQIATGNAQFYDLGYDAADQLLRANLKDAATMANVKQSAYIYDPAGNRTNEQVDSSVTSATYNNLNQLTATAGSGTSTLTLEGNVSEPSVVTVAGRSVAVDPNNRFRTTISVSPGTNAIPITAVDGSGNTTSKTATVTVTSGAPRTLVYDNNGNLTSDGVKTYEWDAANRLLAINYVGTNNRTEFTYDGMSRRVQIVEKTGATINSTKNFVWIGASLAEERDSGNNVTKRFFGEGEQIAGTAYLFAKDHLGSIRQMTDLGGTVRASYSYDPYGRRTKLGGDLDADLGYTSHYYHSPSALCLTLCRGYTADLGRWLSRDPIGDPSLRMMANMPGIRLNRKSKWLLASRAPAEMLQGPNLYEYVSDNPITLHDPLGLWAASVGIGGTFTTPWGGAFSIGFGVAFDDCGNVSGYGYGGPGIGVGTGGSAGASVQVASNAQTVNDLSGWFSNVSGGGGDALGGSVDGFTGTTEDGRNITGGGVTIGAGLGAGAFDGRTDTFLVPIISRSKPCH